MSGNSDVILQQLAQSALQGAVEGLEEAAAIYGRDVKMSLGEFIDLLRASLEELERSWSALSPLWRNA